MTYNLETSRLATAAHGLLVARPNARQRGRESVIIYVEAATRWAVSPITHPGRARLHTYEVWFGTRQTASRGRCARCDARPRDLHAASNPGSPSCSPRYMSKYKVKEGDVRLTE